MPNALFFALVFIYMDIFTIQCKTDTLPLDIIRFSLDNLIFAYQAHSSNFMSTQFTIINFKNATTIDSILF